MVHQAPPAPIGPGTGSSLLRAIAPEADLLALAGAAPGGSRPAACFGSALDAAPAGADS